MKKLFNLFFAVFFLCTITCCSNKTTTEKAADKIENAAEETEDAVEDAADEVEDSVDAAEDNLE